MKHEQGKALEQHHFKAPNDYAALEYVEQNLVGKWTLWVIPVK